MLMCALSQHNFMLLLPILITAALTCCRSTGAVQLDLSNTCSGSSLYYCSITNLTSTFEQPLIWITKTPAEHLNELIIYNSVLGRLPTVMFDVAPNLNTLIMHNCALTSIKPADLENASTLHKLVLKNNRFFIIPERVFNGTLDLEELYLTYNYIHMIHRYAFAHLQKLKYLDLQQNGIRILPDGVFEDLINLEHMDLSFNELEVITTQTFATNNKLTTLLMSENKFSRFEPNALMHLVHLHILDLSNTLLEELQVQSVDFLMVPGSKLKRCIISGAVIKLNAANNALKSFTIHDKLAVSELELHGNMFDSLEGLVGMLNLQKLDISKNQLASLKTSHSPLYFPFPNLVTLNLASNRLQNLTVENFMLLFKLKSLDLAFNHFLRLDSSIFQPLINLEKFYIEGNRLFEFNYSDLKDSHIYLHEVGIFENDWDFRYLKRMLNYFHSHGIRLPMRFTPTDMNNTPSGFHNATDSSIIKSVVFGANDVDMLDDMNQTYHGSSLIKISDIQSHYTTRDYLALITLFVVLLILMVQILRILQEEHCFPNWCRCSWNRGDTQEPLPLPTRHRLLVEETSSV